MVKSLTQETKPAQNYDGKPILEQNYSNLPQVDKSKLRLKETLKQDELGKIVYLKAQKRINDSLGLI